MQADPPPGEFRHTPESLEATLFVLSQAIQNKLSLRIRYKGLERFICPHVLGFSTERHLHCLAYQFAGESGSKPIQPTGSPENWRCLEVAQMEVLDVFSSQWYTATGGLNRLNPGSGCVPYLMLAVDRPWPEEWDTPENQGLEPGAAGSETVKY